MATITSRSIVDDIIRGEGHYQGDPRVMRIVEYRSKWTGETCWWLVYATDRDPLRYEQSDAVLDPRIIWTAAASEDKYPTDAYQDPEVR